MSYYRKMSDQSDRTDRTIDSGTTLERTIDTDVGISIDDRRRSESDSRFSDRSRSPSRNERDRYNVAGRRGSERSPSRGRSDSEDDDRGRRRLLDDSFDAGRSRDRSRDDRRSSRDREERGGGRGGGEERGGGDRGERERGGGGDRGGERNRADPTRVRAQGSVNGDAAPPKPEKTEAKKAHPAPTPAKPTGNKTVDEFLLPTAQFFKPPKATKPGKKEKFYTKDPKIEAELDAVRKAYDDGVPTICVFQCTPDVGRDEGSSKTREHFAMLRKKCYAFTCCIPCCCVGEWFVSAFLMVFGFMMKVGCACCFDRRACTFAKSLIAWTILLIPITYGWYMSTIKVPQCITATGDPFGWRCYQPANVWLWGARVNGKGITFVHIILVVVVCRLGANYFDSLPQFKRHYIKPWRALHVKLAHTMIVMSLLHGAAQIARRWYLQLISKTWEDYELWTGVVLYVIFAFLALPYGVLQSPTWEKSLCMKKFFRLTHVPLFVLWEIMYYLHCFNIHPLVLFLFWWASLRFYEMNVEKLRYRFLVRGAKGLESAKAIDYANPKSDYSIEFEVTFSEEIPVKYGYYCKLARDGIAVSFTMIPTRDSRNKEGHTALFRIAKSSLTESMAKALSKGGDYRRRGLRETDDFAMGWTALQPSFGLRVYGPFISSDYNAGNSANLCALVTGTGNAVSDSLLIYNHLHRGYWRNLSVINAGSKTIGSDEFAVHQMRAVTITNPIQNMSTLAYYASAPRPDIVSVVNLLKCNAVVTRKLMLALEFRDFEFMICSRIWQNWYKDIITVDAKIAALGKGVDAEQITKNCVHLEEFELN